MSVLIKGMEMPKNCEECVLIDIHYFCSLLGEVDESIENGSKDLRCPLVEVPTPHGRLIDAHDLIKDLSIKRFIGPDSDGNPMYEITGRYTSIPIYKVEDAPTVIEAEE